LDIDNTKSLEEHKRRKQWPAVVISLAVVIVGTILISMLIGGFHGIGELFAFIGKQY